MPRPTPIAVDPRFEQLRKLSEINRAFSYTTSLEEVAHLTVVRGANLLHAQAAVLMLQDADDLLHVRASYGISEEKIGRFQAPLSDELMGRLSGMLDAPDENVIAVPLVVGGAVTGILAVALPRRVSDADEWLLSALADQAAVALESARLGGEVKVELEARLRASEGATSAKDRALATLAHDIRSPLAAIDGYITILEDGLFGPVNEKQREALARVRMSGRHLLSLLDNVLDMARLSSGPAVVRVAPTALREVARDAVDILIPASFAKRQKLILERGSDIMVLADNARLRQVLVNLIGNAVKFTPHEGSVTVTTSEVSSDGEAWGEVRVSDTGPGIPERDRAAIFEPYFRSEATASAPGIGLGLAISSALVAQMGGVLSLESTVGVGSTFCIKLPLTRL